MRQSVVRRSYDDFNEWLALRSHTGFNPGSFLQPPMDVAAGATINMVHGGPNNFVGDQTAAAITYDLPANPKPGDRAQLKNGGTGGTPALVNARGGATIEQAGNLGTYSGANGQTTVSGQGTCLVLEFDRSTASGEAGRWNIVGMVSA